MGRAQVRLVALRHMGQQRNGEPRPVGLGLPVMGAGGGTGPPTLGTPAGVGVPITDGDTPIMPAGDGVGVTPITTAGDGAAIIRTTIGEEEVLTTDITTEIRFTEDPGTGSGGTVSSVTGSTGRTGYRRRPHRDLRPVERFVDRHRLVERHRLSPGILRQRELPAASRQAIRRGTAAPRTVEEAAVRRSATAKAAICRATARRGAIAAAARQAETAASRRGAAITAGAEASAAEAIAEAEAARREAPRVAERRLQEIGVRTKSGRASGPVLHRFPAKLKQKI